MSENPSGLELQVFNALPFDSLTLLEEANDSLTLEELDQINSTNIREFIKTADPKTLDMITNFCMEDERLWNVYWDVIYDSAAEVQRRMFTTTGSDSEKSEFFLPPQ